MQSNPFSAATDEMYAAAAVLEISALLFGFYGFASLGVGVMLLFVVRHDGASRGIRDVPRST